MCAHQHAACAHLGTQSHTLWAALPRTHTHASTAVRAAARCTATRARVPRRPATIRRRARPWELRIWSLWLAAALQQVRLRGSPGPGQRFGVCADCPVRRAFAVWRPLRFVGCTSCAGLGSGLLSFSFWVFFLCEPCGAQAIRLRNQEPATPKPLLLLLRLPLMHTLSLVLIYTQKVPQPCADHAGMRPSSVCVSSH